LAVPLNVQVITALAEEPKPLVDLRRAAGSPPQTTMRGHLRYLTEIGVLERQRQNNFPGNVDYELGGPGRELLVVARILDGWLDGAPEAPLQLGSPAAKSSIKALVDGWSSTIVRALAARPLSLTELNRLIAGINYPSLERRLGAMRLAGQIEATPGNRRGTPYVVTVWMRQAIAPLAAAARWERRHLTEATPPITPLDVEAAFLLTVPTLRLPPDQSGICRLAVEIRGGEEHRLAGVLVTVKDGRVVSCVTRLKGHAAAWASGSAADWLRAVLEGDTERLEVGGDCDLAGSLLDGLHGALFRAHQAR
jgi:DNA-binding HxlR family transcriptional regulator